jgi:hypothetical protein
LLIDRRIFLATAAGAARHAVRNATRLCIAADGASVAISLLEQDVRHVLGWMISYQWLMAPDKDTVLRISLWLLYHRYGLRCAQR